MSRRLWATGAGAGVEPTAPASDRYGTTRPQPAGTLARIDRFPVTRLPKTPCIFIALETVRRHCPVLRALLPGTRISYAVKANPAPPMLAALARMHMGFDAVSIGGTGRCVCLGTNT